MRVLVPTEGSEFSGAAIEKCCAMFDGLDNTEIEVLAVAEPTYTPPEPFAVSADYFQELDAANLKKAGEYASNAEDKIRKAIPRLASLSSKVVKGTPTQAIVEEAGNWGADLIVMGSHGYGFWKRALLGSVSSSVVQHAPCSVLVVRRAANN